MRKDEVKRRQWLEEACDDLKDKTKGAKLLLRELKDYRNQLSTTSPEILDKTIPYFENNPHRTDYAKYQKAGYHPIGSGVTEAACKVVAKQRLNNSGMQWTIPAAQHILLLRGLICTQGRWEQFWTHIDKNGL
jgi:hypothetical protein